jgi:hypothetical protein
MDLYLTPAQSLKTSSRTDVGRLLIKSTDISTGRYRVCSEMIIDFVYLSSKYICSVCERCQWSAYCSNDNVDLWLTDFDPSRPYQFHRRFDSIKRQETFFDSPYTQGLLSVHGNVSGWKGTWEGCCGLDRAPNAIKCVVCGAINDAYINVDIVASDRWCKSSQMHLLSSRSRIPLNPFIAASCQAVIGVRSIELLQRLAIGMNSPSPGPPVSAGWLQHAFNSSATDPSLLQLINTNPLPSGSPIASHLLCWHTGHLDKAMRCLLNSGSTPDKRTNLIWLLGV